MVGSTFAYFTATVADGQNTQEIIEATAATVTATFTDGNDISVENIAPDWEGTKTITIENTSSDVEVDYTIDFTGYSNSFENLQYSLLTGVGGDNALDGNGIDGLTEGKGAEEDGNFVTMGKDNLITQGSSDQLVKGHLAAGKKHVFDLTIRLKNTEGAQTGDESAEFTGTLSADVRASKKVTD